MSIYNSRAGFKFAQVVLYSSNRAIRMLLLGMMAECSSWIINGGVLVLVVVGISKELTDVIGRELMIGNVHKIPRFNNQDSKIP
jgi:hypothetical protein